MAGDVSPVAMFIFVFVGQHDALFHWGRPTEIWQQMVHG